MNEPWRFPLAGSFFFFFFFFFFFRNSKKLAAIFRFHVASNQSSSFPPTIVFLFLKKRIFPYIYNFEKFFYQAFYLCGKYKLENSKKKNWRFQVATLPINRRLFRLLLFFSFSKNEIYILHIYNFEKFFYQTSYLCGKYK